MTFEELTKRCKNRNFDQIVVVVKDIFNELEAMKRIMDVMPGDVRTCSSETNPGLRNDAGEVLYKEKRATYYYENTSVCVVQPVEGETIYKKYMDRFGESICCVRERIAAKDYDTMLANFKKKGLKIAQTMVSDTCKAAWVDLTNELGILFEIISDDSEIIKPLNLIPKRIAQINITTPNVQKTMELMVDYLEIGPWEVGRQCNKTVQNSGFLVDGKLEDVEFSFLIAILVCGNIEWEAIEPVKGPLVYNEFLNRRGIGYHHVLFEISQEKWKDELKDYEDKGIVMACKGTLGVVDWCYMNTEDDLHFYTELRNDAVMEKLPEGYFEYFYPSQRDK